MNFRTSRQHRQSIARGYSRTGSHAVRRIGVALLITSLLLGLIPPSLTNGVVIGVAPVVAASADIKAAPVEVVSSTLAESMTLAILHEPARMNLNANRSGIFESAVAEPALAPMQQTTCGTATGDLGGNIFRDYDSDGVDDGTNEPAFTDITVTAYDNNGLVGTAIVQADGSYNFTDIFAGRTGNDAHIRLEFTGLPASAQSGVQGNNSGTTVQFYSAATCDADLAVQNPIEYCEDNPFLATSCFVRGDQSSDLDTLVAFPSTAGITGPFPLATNGPAGHNAPTPSHLATAKQIGTTFGVAYQRSSNTVFASAFAKHHFGFGPAGSGGIYAIDRDSGVVTTFLDANALFGTDIAGTDPRTSYADGTCLNVNTGIEEAPTSGWNCWDHDPEGWDLVGKIGFGDLDISEDEQSLWTVNLNTREVWRIPIGDPPTAPTNPVTIERFAFPLDQADCPDPSIDTRPFGLGVNKGLVYVGAICSAESERVADIFAGKKVRFYVYTLDPSSGTFTQILNLLNWNMYAWDEWKPQFPIDPFVSAGVSSRTPMITDIEFDGGDLVLGLRNRVAEQRTSGLPSLDITDGTIVTSGVNGHGDIWRACPDPNNPGMYLVEGNAACGGDVGQNPNAASTIFFGAPAQGPPDASGTSGEWYSDLCMEDECGLGGLAMMPDGRLASTLYDPAALFSQGVRWFNPDGSASQAYTVLESSQPSSGNLGDGIGKGAGLGDLEVFCSLAPLEIGNRVWEDTDGNGIQDPDEAAINGVIVTLHDMDNGGTQVGSATTGADGTYYFGGANDTNMTSGSLLTNRNYEVRISLGGANLSVNTVTIQNANGITDNNSKTDLADSDAITSDGNAVIAFTTGSAGENNHTLDFGFTPPPPTLSLVKTLVSPADGLADEGETVTFALRIENSGQVTVTEVTLMDLYDPNYLTFDTASATPDATTANTLTWTGTAGGAESLAGNLPLAPAGVFTVTVNFTATKP